MRRTKAADTFWLTLRQALVLAGDDLSDPWTQNPFVRSAVSALYRVVQGVPLVGVTGARAKPKEAKQVGENEPLAMLLAKPNPIQDGGEFAASLVAYRMLEGAAYVVLYGEGDQPWDRTGKRLPREMLTVDPRTVAVDARDNRTGMILRYRIGNATYPADAVAVFREFNPRDLQTGSAPLRAVWSSMEADRRMDEFAAALLKNGANPGTVIALKSEPSKQAMEALRAQFDDKHAGSRKAGKTVVTGPDMDLKAFPAQTAKDMESAAARAEARDRVKAVLGVTDYEVGRVADYNRANSEAARAWLWTNTILPILESIEAKLWSHVFEPISRGGARATWAKFDLSGVAALRPAMVETSTAAATLIGTGATDPQEVFEMLGLPLKASEIADPTADATTTDPVATDTVSVADTALNGAQVSSLLEILSAVSAGTLTPEGAIATIMVAFPSVDAAEARRIVGGALEAPPPVVAPPSTEPASKSGPTIIIKRGQPKPLPRSVALRIQRQWQRHAERRLGVQWRRFTGKRYAETIRQIRNLTDLGAPDPETVERVLGAAQEWRDGAKAAAERGLKGLGRPLVENMGDTLGTRLDVGQEVYEAAALRRVGQMVNVGDKLRGTIRDSITRAIADAGTDGLGVDGLEKIVEARFGGRLPSNAATVARTETGIFASDVRRSLMVSQGIEEHIWSAANDQHTRETHRAIDGERRPMGERFSNGLLHPLETGAPAGEVVNCRCVELPWIPEADE